MTGVSTFFCYMQGSKFLPLSPHALQDRRSWGVLQVFVSLSASLALPSSFCTLCCLTTHSYSVPQTYYFATAQSWCLEEQNMTFVLGF